MKTDLILHTVTGLGIWIIAQRTTDRPWSILAAMATAKEIYDYVDYGKADIYDIAFSFLGAAFLAAIQEHKTA